MDGSSINIWDKRSEEEHRIAPGSAGSNILLTNNAWRGALCYVVGFVQVHSSHRQSLIGRTQAVCGDADLGLRKSQSADLRCPLNMAKVFSWRGGNVEFCSSLAKDKITCHFLTMWWGVKIF